MPAGRPPFKFKSVEEMQEKIDAYFADCDPHVVEKQIVKNNEVIIERAMSQQKPYTITGLALALDTDRETLIRYGLKEEFGDAIKKAKMKCQNYAENYLFSGKNPIGPIFNLKNNYGWKDEIENNVNGSIGFNVTVTNYGANNSLQLPTQKLPTTFIEGDGRGVQEGSLDSP